MGKRGPKKMELNTPMRKAAALFGAGWSVAAVARELDKPEQTLYTWRKRDDFLALVNVECNKCLTGLRAKAVAFLERQLDADPLDTKEGWLGQGAARELAAQYARLEQVSAGQLTVSFTGGMPEPKMPEQAASPEEQGEENE